MKGEVLHEPVSVFDVAINAEQAPELMAIAYEMGRRAGQACVYVRLPDGQVEMIDTADLSSIERRAA